MKRFVVAALVGCLALPAFAQDAPLGRLFLTPDQRAALDNARRNKIRAEAIAATEPVEKKPKPPRTRSITINGIVQRSDGESVIWVNGKATDGRTDDGMHVGVSPASQGTVVVRGPGEGRRVELRVGQRANMVTGRVDDAYERKRSASREKSAQQSSPRPASRPPRAVVRPGASSEDPATDETPDQAEVGDEGPEQ